ncbi:hypothetical protein [Ruania albidiflava]|uniref:hypothetical protein n=1 Tax=Ruania albidiflava TaxID=366586 RepID=UPI0023F18D67|nr:hypothetical protein [Ruania albidiflava]
MRRTVMACGAAIVVLAGGCSGDDPGPDPTAPPSSEPGEPTAPSSSPSTAPDPPFDPQQVDLAEQEWQFATVYQDPVDVPLESGEATGEFGQWEGKFELGEDEPLYVDIDDDGDQDVVASMSFSFETAPETYQWVATTWFVWLNDGEQLTQLPYPLAGSGDCDTQVDSVARADGSAGVVIDEAQMGWQSACAEGAGIEVTRTVQVSYDQDDQPWLVQTDPFPSWGGACPMMVEPSDAAGEVHTAPGLEPASPEVAPVVVTGGESWLGDEVDGWDFVTYLQEEDPNFVSYCGWTQ